MIARRRKKGQITLFIIVGVIILLVVSISLMMRASVTKRDLSAEIERDVLPNDVVPIRNYMEFCLEKLLTPSIFLLGIQGGYLNPPDDALLTRSAVVAYGAIDGENMLPTHEQIQLELETYLEESIEVCSASLIVFENQGLKIERGDADATVSVTGDSVLALIEYPVTVTLLDSTYGINEFFVSVPIRLGYILDELDLIIATIVENPEFVDYEGLSQRGGHVSIMPYNEETILYSFQDKESTIDEAPFTFMFAVKDSTVNTPPELLFVENLVMTIDDLFSYEVIAMDAEYDKLTFYTDNPAFPIDAETGFLNMTPSRPGVYQIVIGVRDKHGLEDEQGVRIEIVQRTEEEAIR